MSVSLVNARARELRQNRNEVAMAVGLESLSFQNQNNVDVSVRVEAPIGTTIIGPRNVAARTSVLLIDRTVLGSPVIYDCPSMLIEAGHLPHHQPSIQTISITTPPPIGPPPPQPPRRAFLKRVTAHYRIGELFLKFSGRTEGSDLGELAEEVDRANWKEVDPEEATS